MISTTETTASAAATTTENTLRTTNTQATTTTLEAKAMTAMLAKRTEHCTMDSDCSVSLKCPNMHQQHVKLTESDRSANDRGGDCHQRCNTTAETTTTAEAVTTTGESITNEVTTTTATRTQCMAVSWRCEEETE